MKNKILAIILAIAVMTIPVMVSADSGKGKTYDTKIKVGDKVKISKDVEATFKGYDTKSNKPIWTSTIEAPIYADKNTKIDCTWSVAKDVYTSGNNLFTAVVKGEAVSINKGELTWKPTIELVPTDTAKKLEAKYQGTAIIKDYINDNYGMNTLRLTYKAGDITFYRDLRLIEGVLCEYYKFDTNPNADIYIVQNAEGDIDKFASASAWSADNKVIKITNSWNRKTVYAATLTDVKFPIIIDPSPVYYSSAADGYIQSTDYCFYDTWESARTAFNGTPYSSGTMVVVGAESTCAQTSPPVRYHGYSRGYLFFDTSGLADDVVITGATLSLYGYWKILNGLPEFIMRVQDGTTDTYPHNPLESDDFTYNKYTGDGGTLSSAVYNSNAYNDITLNSSGRAWINPTGLTKFTLRPDYDIDGTMAGAATSACSSVLWFRSYEYGVGYRPKLTITYTSALPTCVTNDATSIACTSATLNGELTNNGGDTVTKEGFVWSTTSHTEPTSITAPAASAYASNDINTSASYAVGNYNHPLTGLTEGTTYYARFVTYNSNGYKYSNEITFVCWHDPVVITQPATEVGTTTANLQAQITEFGGDYCEVRFGYGTTDQGNTITNYNHYTVYSGSYETGAHPLLSASGLTANTTYYFNVQAQNNCGATTGTSRSFTTESAVGSPTNVVAIPSYDSVTLTWSKGIGATKTVIRFKTNSCPASETDGTSIYDGAASTYVQTGLIAGTDYCYYIRGYESTIGYSTNSVIIHATTLAGVAGTGTFTNVPTQPANWAIDPNATNVAAKNPAAPYIADIATSTGIPLNNLWLLLAMLGITVIGYVVYRVSHHTIPTVIAIMIGMGIGSAVTIIPAYLTAIIVIIGGGIIFLQNRSNV